MSRANWLAVPVNETVVATAPVSETEVAAILVNPELVKVKVFPPVDPVRAKLVKVATPATAATVVVPVKVPEPLVTATLTLPVKNRSTKPAESRAWTTG